MTADLQPQSSASFTMRLINTSTGQFEEFIGRNIPKYAILSHTWEGGEVSLKDVENGIHQNKEGWKKIAKTCELAARDGLGYAWVGTSRRLIRASWFELEKATGIGLR